MGISTTGNPHLDMFQISGSAVTREAKSKGVLHSLLQRLNM